jgi:hypothetical protein
MRGTRQQWVVAFTALLLNMRRLRLWIVLVTLLTQPGYGLAGLAHACSCQVQMAAATHGGVAAGDCCPGKSNQGDPCKRLGDNPGKNGDCTPCKAGCNCKSPQSYEPTHLMAMLVVPACSAITSNSPTLLVSHGTNGLWRPPRLI